jgi:hypothetical protein
MTAAATTRTANRMAYRRRKIWPADVEGVHSGGCHLGCPRRARVDSTEDVGDIFCRGLTLAPTSEGRQRHRVEAELSCGLGEDRRGAVFRRQLATRHAEQRRKLDGQRTRDTRQVHSHRCRVVGQRPGRFGTGLAFGGPFGVAVAVRAPAVGERWLVIPR